MYLLAYQNLTAPPTSPLEENTETTARSAVDKRFGDYSLENIQKLIEEKQVTFSQELNATASSTRQELQGIIEKSKNDFEARAAAQQADFIQLIGIFTAVLALISITFQLVKSAKHLFEAICLILAITCSLTLFASLVHWFFAKEGESKALVPIISSVAILGILLFLSWRDRENIKQDKPNRELPKNQVQ
jgi:hypothetical protein